MKRKYEITIVYQVQKDVEIEAESLEEAKQKALLKESGGSDPDILKEKGTTHVLCKTLLARDNGSGKTLYRNKMSA